MNIYATRRRGFSLLETMVYVSLSAVLVTLTAQWFHVLLQSAAKNRQRQHQHVSLKQLAWDFRDDVYRSTNLQLNDDGTRLTLTDIGGETIHYRISDRHVRRWVGLEQTPSRQQVYRNLRDLRIEFESIGLPDGVTINVFRPVLPPAIGSTRDPQLDLITDEIPILQISSTKRSPRLAPDRPASSREVK